MIVSCEASDNFHRRRFQNDRFVRGCFKISQKKLPKRAFRAKLPTIFTEEGSKMIVSCEASGNFHGKNIQKDRFARCFRQFSQKKHPKGSFRAMLPTIFTEKTFKRTESLKWKKIPQKNGKKFPEKFWTHFDVILAYRIERGTFAEAARIVVDAILSLGKKIHTIYHILYFIYYISHIILYVSYILF